MHHIGRDFRPFPSISRSQSIDAWTCLQVQTVIFHAILMGCLVPAHFAVALQFTTQRIEPVANYKIWRNRIDDLHYFLPLLKIQRPHKEKQLHLPQRKKQNKICFRRKDSLVQNRLQKVKKACVFSEKWLDLYSWLRWDNKLCRMTCHACCHTVQSHTWMLWNHCNSSHSSKRQLQTARPSKKNVFLVTIRQKDTH